MKLIRSGVFETNSSSAHSLAYGTSKVVRGAGYGLPPNETDFSNPLYHLTEVPEYYKGETLIAQLDDFGWGYEQGYIDHQSYGMISESLFKTKEDLITYLFNDNLVIYIESDNDDYQEWYTGERNDD